MSIKPSLILRVGQRVKEQMTLSAALKSRLNDEKHGSGSTLEARVQLLLRKTNQARSTSEQPFREMFVRVVVQSRLSLAEWKRPERVWKRFPSRTFSCCWRVSTDYFCAIMMIIALN